MKLTRIAQALALMGLVGTALAQTPAPASNQKLEKVTVTGSSIKRLADQSALPIETLSRAEIAQLGITSAEELVNLLSANVDGANNPTSTNTVFGADQDRLTGGGSFANLRGLGPTGTLVLLNGRRVSTHGMSGGSVDLSTIPMEAIERVETLKDGASAIYGTDAIGGVVNFILRKNVQGVALNASYSTPEASGGGQRTRISGTAGFGSFEKDGYNFMGSVTVDSNTILRGIDRSWATGYQPQNFLTPDTTSSNHANIIGAAGTALTTAGTVVGATDATRYTNLNLLAIRGQCEALPFGVPLAPNVTIWDKFGYTNANSRYRCARDYGRMFMLSAPRDATNVLLRGSFDLGGHTAAIEAVASRNVIEGEYAPFQFSTTSNAVTHYPVNGPYYLNMQQLVGATQFNPTLPIAYRLNMWDWGYRLNEQQSDNVRVQATLDGEIWGYDYSMGIGYGSAEASTLLKNGYADTNKLVALLASGKYNPFLLPGQEQTQEVKDLIEAMQVRGRIFGGKTSVLQADATISGQLGKFMAGNVDFAVGTNLRQESYEFTGTQTYTCVSTFTVANMALPNSVMGCPGNASSPKLSRDIAAVFGELVLNPAKNLQVTLQARHDRYEEIGGTTNPKIGVRFQPTDELMIRASANTGFRAPTPQQLKLGTVELALTGTYRDPELCADPANPRDATQCNRASLPYRQGGNPTLKPEESEQSTIGFVFAPSRNTQFYADWWRVKMSDRIRTLSPTFMITNYDLFKDNFIRDPATGRVNYIQAGWVNAADSDTEGLDFGAKHVLDALDGRVTLSFSGTKMISHKERLIETAPLVQYVGEWSNTTLYLPWRLNGSVSYRKGPWNTTLSATYRDEYKDQDMSVYSSTAPAVRMVQAHTTFNLTGSYTGFKGLTLSASVLNVFDRDPPFTWHNVDSVIGAGWDPRVADPRGRTFSIAARWDLR